MALRARLDLVAVPTIDLPGDGELVARVRAGDEAACEALFLAHHEGLWRFAYGYVRSREVAEEVVQDVFLDLWRGRAAWTVQASVRAWLYGAVRHRALNHRRHARVVARLADVTRAAGPGHPDAAPGLPGLGAPPADAHAQVEAHELDDAVHAALAGLPERRRMAMALRWKHELSAAEIAGVLGTTPEAVRVLLTRARRELAGLLGRLRP